ncbi:Hypothetical predicted protein [Paramuricea clavata]|uniref:DUF5641 domain-containing protein n=1 Tax=Paramuricea clavata TaxID=317549 RepID=A0A6S7JRU5_PARCT|nr:Hypothetical predicted protein [Paramuricea clavata]
MQRAHTSGHRWRDATLARFRQLYWVTQGSKLAQSIKSKCQMCKLREAKFLEQQMGQLPEARLKPAPAFNHVMIDLFGPYSVRGEVQKRTSGKAYRVIFTDLVKRAVHIEAVFGYDAESFLMALSGFVSVRDREDEFWKKWTELYAPALVIRRKWNTANRNLRPGDLVIIADRNTLRGDYRLGIVQEVFPSQDGKVRRVNVMYKNFQIGEKVQKYKGHNEAVIVSRSAQRLSLSVLVDMDQDQETKSEAKESV